MAISKGKVIAMKVKTNTGKQHCVSNIAPNEIDVLLFAYGQALSRGLDCWSSSEQKRRYEKIWQKLEGLAYHVISRYNNCSIVEECALLIFDTKLQECLSDAKRVLAIRSVNAYARVLARHALITAVRDLSKRREISLDKKTEDERQRIVDSISAPTRLTNEEVEEREKVYETRRERIGKIRDEIFSRIKMESSSNNERALYMKMVAGCDSVHIARKVWGIKTPRTADAKKKAQDRVAIAIFRARQALLAQYGDECYALGILHNQRSH